MTLKELDFQKSFFEDGNMAEVIIKQDEVATSLAINKLMIEKIQKQMYDTELEIYANVESIPQLKGKT